jgi:hypothetical protein
MTRAYNTATTQQNSGGAVSGVTAGKNAIINGGADIWQRGTSFASGNGLSVYTADRWHFYRSSNIAGATLSRQTSGLTGFQYAIRIQRNSGNTSTDSMGLRYTLESADSYRLAGKTVTLSFYLRKGADYSGTNFVPYIASGTGTDQPVYAFTSFTTVATSTIVPTTSWVRYSVTGTVASNATEVGLEMFSYASGTAGTNDYVDITGLQLEVGSVATEFSRAGGTIQGELAACQRYYYLHTSGDGFDIAGGWYYSSTSVRSSIKFPVAMRIAPTLIASSGTNHYKFEVNGGTDLFNDWVINSPTPNSAGLVTSTNVSGTAGQAGHVLTANASSSLAFNSEL